MIKRVSNKAIAQLLAASAISLGIVYVLMLGFMPVTFWFHYDAVNAEDALIDQDIRMLSIRTTERTVDLEFVDVLRCDLDDGDGFRFISNQEPIAFRIEANREPAPWLYTAEKPMVPATCFVESEACTQIFIYRKCEYIVSNQFNIFEEGA